MLYIYILKLEQNKYYIGETNDPNMKLDSNSIFYNNKWTKKYKPIKIHALIDDCDFYDKYKYTLKYIEKEGIYNVRSDSFPQIELSNEQHKLIYTMINGFNNKCVESDNSIVIKILDFFKGINDENIDYKIDEINKIYEEILKLKDLINRTKEFKIDDYVSKKQEIVIINEIDKTISEKQLLLNNTYVDSYSSNYNIKSKRNHKKLREQEINNDIYRLRGEKNNIIKLNKNISDNEINGFYKSIIMNTTTNKHAPGKTGKNILIKYLELVSFNLDKRKRLNEIFERYENEEFIVELLSKLYKKKIKLMVYE